MKSKDLLTLDKISNLRVFSDDGAVLLVLLVEDLGVLEMLNEAGQSLQASIGQVANLYSKRNTFSLRYLSHFWPWNSS